MPVTQNVTFSATPPTTGENPTTFNYNAISCWDDLKNNIVPALNTAFGQLNELETNVNAKEVSCVNSALSAASDSLLAAGAANNKGAWSLLTGALNIPAAVNHSGSIWILNRNIANVALSMPTPTNTDWTETNGITQQDLDAVSAASVKTTTDQTIAGIKTFSSNPISSATQSTNANALTKYSAVVKNTGDETIAGIKTFSSPIKLASSGFTATLQSGTLSGNVVHTLPTVSSSLAPLSSPAFTGTPTINGSDAISNSTLRTALNASGTAPMYACRAWVNFNGTGTVAIRGSGNVSSISDNSTGDYTINFITAIEDVNYSFVGIGADKAGTSSSIGILRPYSLLTTSISFNVINLGATLLDRTEISAHIIR